jgi:hypothetical protein
MSGTSRLREQVAYSTSVAPQQMYPAEFVRGRARAAARRRPEACRIVSGQFWGATAFFCRPPPRGPAFPERGLCLGLSEKE